MFLRIKFPRKFRDQFTDLGIIHFGILMTKCLLLIAIRLIAVNYLTTCIVKSKGVLGTHLRRISSFSCSLRIWPKHLAPRGCANPSGRYSKLFFLHKNERNGAKGVAPVPSDPLSHFLPRPPRPFPPDPPFLSFIGKMDLPRLQRSRSPKHSYL